jgi:hypothetical protein
MLVVKNDFFAVGWKYISLIVKIVKMKQAILTRRLFSNIFVLALKAKRLQ